MNMNENIELLNFIYQNAEMALANIDSLKGLLKGKENKIISLIDDMKEEYQKFLDESRKLFDELGETGKELGKMPKIMAYMNMKMDLMSDNSDTKVADILIKGSTMGTVEIEKEIKKYEESASKEILKLAKDLLKFETKNIDKLKVYL